MNDSFLNYHHLRYFHAIATEGHLTRAAAHLHLSQSALSLQLRKLEESLGHALFLREGKRLVLTEAGRITLDHARRIFSTGQDLIATLSQTGGGPRRVLRVGTVSTLSRNFLLSFFRPLIGREDCELVIQSGSLQDLLTRLGTHTLDLVLSQFAVPRDAHTNWHSHLLDEQEVSLVGRPVRPKRRYPDCLANTPLILPGPESGIRIAFDRVLDAAGLHPVIAAEVDDMAMLRLLARESDALTLVPRVVVRDELKSRQLVECHRFSEIRETFYAITPTRRFPNPLARELLTAWKLPEKRRNPPTSL